MICHFQYGGPICGEAKRTALWVMNTADWNCENDIKVGIVFLAINSLWFKDKRPVCGEGYGS